MKYTDEMIGQTFNELTVIEHIDKRIFRFRCSCGNEKNLDISKVKSGYIKSCGHRNMSVEPNKQYGEWTTLEYLGNRKWKCRCSCGTISEVGTYQLSSGRSKSCGHDSGKLKNLVGQKFGELTVLEYAGNMKWKCRCSCGKEVIVNRGDLKTGNTKSCGHLLVGRKPIDLMGQRFGEWTVEEYLGNSYWKCRCSCGAVKRVHSYTLRNKLSLNCGNGAHKVTDLTNKKFGELEVLKYIGNMYWLCKCSCGSYKAIRGCNLINGSTKSCGCKTDEIKRNTLLNKYGEISSSKANSINKRSQEQLSILLNPDNLSSFSVTKLIKLGRKPTLMELASELNITQVTLKHYLKEYGLTEIILDTQSVNRSQGEIEVEEYCKSIISDNIEVIHSDRTILQGKELDIYIPDKKLAIEFNGTYWHSSLFKDKTYHQDKTIECAKQGVRLIHIFEYEWLDVSKQDKIKEYLRNILDNTNQKVIYARECEVDNNLSTLESDMFLDKYHLQGIVKSSIRYGLRYNGELVGLMTFGVPRFNSNYEYELIRLAWKSDCRVIAGTKKLFKAFIRDNNPSSIISYCDISKFTGNVYKKLNFKSSLEDLTSPNYVWVEPVENIVLSRYKTQKQKLLDKGLGEYGNTEKEIMDNLGYLQVFDCGNIRYHWCKG